MNSKPFIATLRKSRNKVIPFAQAAYLAAVASAMQLATDSIPEEGAVVWSCRVGSDRRYYYHLEVRTYPNHQYRVVWRHSSGHQNPSDTAYTFLVDALLEALLQRRDYYQAEADDREAALEAYYADLALQV